jgi:hypothetical protein
VRLFQIQIAINRHATARQMAIRVSCIPFSPSHESPGTQIPRWQEKILVILRNLSLSASRERNVVSVLTGLVICGLVLTKVVILSPGRLASSRLMAAGCFQAVLLGLFGSRLSL